MQLQLGSSWSFQWPGLAEAGISTSDGGRDELLNVARAGLAGALVDGSAAPCEGSISKPSLSVEAA